ncbi:hypothetical protein F2P81_000143 [Scophthalmus maximus]|uniref:Uncharacterized protein n=1 Tax=Scophthalmus maximus TaxID=52904 RepID=A0A6A4TSE9_SCOMX|nr:hypothetical protein F2P81_000143 [Scophthalmus maximus]
MKLVSSSSSSTGVGFGKKGRILANAFQVAGSGTAAAAVNISQKSLAYTQDLNQYSHSVVYSGIRCEQSGCVRRRHRSISFQAENSFEKRD